MKRILGFIALVVFALSCLLSLPRVALADLPYYVLGYQNSNSHSGIMANIWVYPWKVAVSGNPPQGPGKHVSSLYVNADGLLLDNDYVEAGFEKDQTTIDNGNDQRPEFFVAYEDYPNTFGQERAWVVDGQLRKVSTDAWHTVKIANYTPFAGTSDWCVYLDGNIKVDFSDEIYALWFQVGKPITRPSGRLS